MKILRTFDRALTSIVMALLVTAFAIMLGLAAVQVFLRGVFHTGLLWGDVAARHLVIWVGFFGAYLATRENKHFHIDILTRFLSQRLRLWFAAFSDLFAAVICSLLMRASLTYLTVGMDAESTLFLGIPQRTVAMIVPIGFGLIMVQFLLRMVECIIQAVRGPALEGEKA
jgi:TRAP-type C4-dicarboxylate transport system permease small subunit